MLYQFKCKTCDHEQEESFLAVDYDEHVEEDGRLKDITCEKCKTKSLYRHITRAPGVLGGTKGYMSMERWQSLNPDHARKKEEALTKRLAQRRENRNKRIDKQTPGGKRDQRHEGYGKGKGEERLTSDE